MSVATFPALSTPKEAAELLRVSLATFDKLVADGKISVRYMGPRKRVVTGEELAAFVEALPSDAPQTGRAS